MGILKIMAGRIYDQVAVSSDNLPSGSYIVSLIWNGRIKDNVKLIISK